MWVRWFLTGILCAAVTGSAGAQDDEFDLDLEDLEEAEEAEVETLDPSKPGDHWWGNAWPRFERGIHVHLGRTTREGSLLFLVEHRGNAPLQEEPARSLFGLDKGGVKIGLGLRYGILDNLDIGAYRINGTLEPFDTYEFDFKMHSFRVDQIGADVAVRGGLSWFEGAEEDAAAPLAQLLVSRLLTPRLMFGTGLLFHGDSTNDVKSVEDTDWSLAVPIVAQYRFFPGFSMNAEIVHSVAGYGASKPVIALAPKFITNRHTFAIVVGNSQYMGADGIVANTDRGLGDFMVGFAITREFSIVEDD